jgi:UDP-N-acetylmuramoylalanine--D-glutamate ligase
LRVDRIENKEVGVIGAARSGLSAARLLRRHGARVFVSDSKPSSALSKAIEVLKAEEFEFESNGHTERVYSGMDYVIISPGVPPDAAIVKDIQSAGIPLISEIELGYWMCDAHIAAITGSNGKTTTTTLTGEIFKQSNLTCAVAGNIGSPFCDICDEIPSEGWVVLEISSAQLERCYEFRPEIAAVLNLTPDHLDRYSDFESYSETKLRIAAAQSSEDTLVVNYDDEYLVKLATQTASRKAFFSTREKARPGIYIEGGNLVCSLDSQVTVISAIEDIGIKGPHNIANAAAASLIAVFAGVEIEQVRTALNAFEGVEHRLEKCGLVGGVSFVNDSKATNVDSVWYALQSVPGKLVVIMGGRDKKGEFSRLYDLVRQNVSSLILLGEAAPKLEEVFTGTAPIHRVADMDEAVAVGYNLAQPDGTVLLSPGCASFDMYEDFEHRGRVFKSAVNKLKEAQR